MSLVTKARDLAKRLHHGQTRKYTGEPYFLHCAAVVDILEGVWITDEATIAAAWLHDTIEDCGAFPELIAAEFGTEVAQIVVELSDPPVVPGGPNRAARKAADRRRLACASEKAQTIKLADLIDNTSSIVARDPNFAVTYMREKAALLPFLQKGNLALWRRASVQTVVYEQSQLDAHLASKPHA